MKSEDRATINLRRYLTSFGFDIDLVVDVGVNEGTPWLYQAFADHHFILVDPMQDLLQRMKVKPNSYSLVSVALGAEEGVLPFHDQGGRSSFMEVNEFDSPARLYAADTPEANPKTYEVPIKTLDALLAEQNPDARFGLKLDVEGYERPIIKGGAHALRNCRFIVLEISILQRFKNGDMVSDIFAELAEAGFEFYNFLNAWDEKPKFYDFLFLPRDTDMVPITYDEGSAMALLFRSRMADRAGDAASAVALAEEAAQRAPDSVAVRIWRSELHYKSGEFREALALAQALLNRVPSHTPALNMIAACNRQLGDHEAARTYAELCYSLDPLTPKYIREHAIALLNAGEKLEALDVCRRYLDEWPNDVEAYKLFAVAARKCGRKDEADAAALDGLRRFPRHKDLLRIYTAG